MTLGAHDDASSSTAAGTGVFVVIEGPEGAGKSTQIARLAARLRALGRDPLLTREPGGTPTGDAVRDLLLDPGREITPLAEFLLYSASRAQLVENVIAPALASGRDVICDRYTSASIAYQGYGRGLDLALIAEVNQHATRGLTPDVTVLLDIDHEAGLVRAAQRSTHDRLEAAGLEFHARVREGFLVQASGRHDWLVIDASASEELVGEQLWRGVESRLPRLTQASHAARARTATADVDRTSER